MRNAGQRDRRRKRAAASLGKYHFAFAHTQSDAESFVVSERDTFFLVNGIGDSICFGNAYVRVPHWQPSCVRADESDAHADEFARR